MLRRAFILLGAAAVQTKNVEVPKAPLSPRRAPPAPSLGVGFASGAWVKRSSTLSVSWVVCVVLWAPSPTRVKPFWKSLKKLYYQKYII